MPSSTIFNKALYSLEKDLIDAERLKRNIKD